MLAKLLISPSLEERVGEINKILPEFNLSLNHPDLFYLPNDAKVGIAEARKIKDHLAYKSFSGKIRAVVLEDVSNLTVEAQNALLKTLEELPENGLFILGTDSDAKLLPTVVSRCQVVNLAERSKYNDYNNYKNYTKDLEDLLKADIPQRFEYVEKLKDREEFLHFMVQYFRQLLYPPGHFYHDRDIFVRDLKDFLRELLSAEEWAKQNVNIRAILEYLVLKMPKAE